MSGSSFGKIFKITTFGESHGKAVGVVIDGCPSGIPLSGEDIQPFMDRRKPGQSAFTTRRDEDDKVEILSGLFEGKTTGTPIAILIRNKDQHSMDYSEISQIFRPGHADFTFSEKYGIRDYRGGGRSSGRETAARVAAGAVAVHILKKLGIDIFAYTSSIGPVSIDDFDAEERDRNPLFMPDRVAFEKASEYVKDCSENKDSVGGVVSCRVTGLKSGIGETVFDKLDACLSHAIMSIGAVKGFEIGDGFASSGLKGSENNDPFYVLNGKIKKSSNHSGGVLGGISDGDSLFFRAAFKPTPSIALKQNTVTQSLEETEIEIKGRHDPVIVPRAVVVVEAMTAITILDLMLQNMTSRFSDVEKFYL